MARQLEQAHTFTWMYRELLKITMFVNSYLDRWKSYEHEIIRGETPLCSLCKSSISCM